MAAKRTSAPAGAIARLRELPFVASVRLRGDRLTIVTKASSFDLQTKILKTHLGREVAEAIVAGHGGEPVLVVAPAVGAQVGDAFAQGGINFIDDDGNCYVNLADRYVARVQRARREGRRAASTALRAAGYQVLFGLLADERLRTATVRELADATGVSIAPAHQTPTKLIEQGLGYREKDGSFAWFPAGRDDALAMFLAGYGATLRRKLLVGRYRMPEDAPDAAERRIETALRGDGGWAFGGGSGAARLTRHYHGPRVTLHLADPSAQRLRALRAVPDRDGPVVILRTPGPVGLRGDSPHVAHSLLLYAELLSEGGERAREAAKEVLARWRTST